MTKPFDRQELVMRVKNLLDGRKKLRERFGKQLVIQPAEVTVTSTDEKFLQSVFATLEKTCPTPTLMLLLFVRKSE
jgi:DNA-binding response OmpR family regulator